MGIAGDADVRDQLLDRRIEAAGTVLDDITGELDTPSTATAAAGRLWVVNPRFNTPPSPSTEYWIAQLPLRPENG